MGRLKVIYTDREGKHKREYIIEFSNKEELHKEHKRVFEDWIKETQVLNFWTVSISSA